MATTTITRALADTQSLLGLSLVDHGLYAHESTATASTAFRWVAVNAEFVQVDAVRLVDCASIDDVQRLDVTDSHVRLVLRLTPEERSQLDVQALRARLIERGARTVLDSMIVVRDSVIDAVDTQVPGRTSLERGVQVLRAWLDGCGEDRDVVERSLEMLDDLVAR